MAYTFKKLSDIGQLDRPTEQTHVLVEDNSEIKRILVDNLGGGTVKSVNKVAPDENGNIEIEFPSYTVNGTAADENGNFEIEIPECAVKSVNGVKPDENGNIEIEMSGGASSWEELTDKPFEVLTESFIINSENGFENSEIVVDASDDLKLYYVSDRFITLEEMKRGSIKVNHFYNEEQYFYEEPFESCSGDNSYTIGLNEMMVLSVDHDNAEVDGMVLPKAGTYFSHSEQVGENETIIYDIEYLNIAPKIKKLDVKFLPNGIGYDVEIPAQSIPEQTIEVSDSDSPAILQENLIIVKDTTYKVVFDGEQYDCRGKYSRADDIYFIGNGKIAELDYIWGSEPFVIASQPESKRIFVFTNTSGTHTFSIDSQSTVNHVIIDSEYLPEPIGRADFRGGGEIFNDANGAEGRNSHAEGLGTFAFGEEAHAEGHFTTAFGSGSHSEGRGSLNHKTFKVHPSEVQSSYDSITDSELAGAVNEDDILYVNDTFVTVWKISDDTVHFTPSIPNEYLYEDLYIDFPAGFAYGNNSHSEGRDTRAYGENSHSEGKETVAYSWCSHAEGEGTKAIGAHSHVQGKYNIEDTDSRYAHIVGNGEDNESRSNAHTLDWEGNAWYAGNVTAKYFILESPDGSLFKITVDNAGNLSAEAMPE